MQLDDFPYIAGYFDAEGCVGLAFSTAWSCYVQFKQTQPQVIAWLLQQFDGNTWIEEPEVGRRLLRLRFCSFAETTRFLRAIEPFCKEKHEQVVKVLEQYRPDSTTNWRLKRELEDLKKAVSRPLILEKHLAVAVHDPNRLCSVVGCTKKSFARGRCSVHYTAARLKGEFTPRKRQEGVPFVYDVVPTDDDRRYLAGYFDGDGCVLVHREKYGWGIKVHFGQTQLHAIKLMHTIYHGSLSERRVKPGCKPVFDLQIVQREAALAFLRDVQPYTKEKRDQIDIALAQYDPRASKETGVLLQQTLTAMKKREYTKNDLTTLVNRVVRNRA
jgi:hypothetical protein